MIRKSSILAAIVLGLGFASESVKAQTATDFSAQVVGLATTRYSRPTFSTDTTVASGVSQALGIFGVAEAELLRYSGTTSETTFGIGVIKLGDGDEIFYLYVGSGSPMSQNVLSISLTATIVGGTGAFASASGSFTIDGSLSTSTGQLIATFDGTIDTP